MSDPDEPEEISAHDKYKPFQREVTIWLKDSELSLPEFAQFLRVEPAPLRETIAGKRIRPWLLERVRSLTGIDPPTSSPHWSVRGGGISIPGAMTPVSSQKACASVSKSSPSSAVDSSTTARAS